MFNVDINLYGIFIIISLICYFIVAFIISQKYKISRYYFIISVTYELIFIIIGAIFLTYITNFIKDGVIIIGLSSLGGAIGAIIAIFLFSITFKQDLTNFLTVYIVPLPLAYGIAKIGCALVGCCYGIEYNGFGSIVYKYSLSAPNGVMLFPVQIVEVIINIIIFIILMIKLYKGKSQLNLIADCFILTCGIKFITDFLRDSHNGIIISLNQSICLVFIVIGIFILLNIRKLSING